MIDTKLRIARKKDEKYIRHLQVVNNRELGFLTSYAVNWYIEAGQVRIGEKNESEAGYLLGNQSTGDMPDVSMIFQACVQMDCRRDSIGRVLVDDWLMRSRARGAKACRLYCKDQLESHAFWAACGFTPIGLREGGNQRKPIHVLWEFTLDKSIAIDTGEQARLVPGSIRTVPLPTRRRGAALLPVPVAKEVTKEEVLNAIAENHLRDVFERSVLEARQESNPAVVRKPEWLLF